MLPTKMRLVALSDDKIERNLGRFGWRVIQYADVEEGLGVFRRIGSFCPGFQRDAELRECNAMSTMDSIVAPQVAVIPCEFPI